MGLFSNDSDDLEYSEERVAELVDRAKGNLKQKHLTKDSGAMLTYLYDGPLITHLEDGEQPEYIFSHQNKGYRITEPDGKELTPHHKSSEGKRYLLVTDQRLLYVAGRESGDETIEHGYDEIVDIELSGGTNIQFYTTDGKTYKFAAIGASNSTLRDAIDYISERSTGEESEEKTKSEIEVPEDGEIVQQFTVDFYGFDDTDNNDIDTRTIKRKIKVRMTNDSVIIGEDDFEVKYKEIAEVYNYEYRQVSRNVQEVPRLLSDGKYSVAHANLKIREGVEFILGNGSHIVLYNEEFGRNRQKRTKRARLPNVSVSFPNKVINLLNRKTESNEVEIDAKYILVRPFNSGDANLRVEGWTDGASQVDANVEANSKTRGKSRGVQVGPFSRSKTTSKSSIEGNISGSISDNTYSSRVVAFKIYNDHLIIDSDIWLDLHYSEIDNIFEQTNGVVLEVGATTFRVENLPNDSQINEAVNFIKSRITEFESEEKTTVEDESSSSDSEFGEKIRELKELHEEGILTDEEFESKKEELLDDF